MLLDCTGRRRSPATIPRSHAGRPPRNKGLRYSADPPKVEEIIAVMRAARDGEVGMDAWGWEELQPWLELPFDLPIGPLFCVITGHSRGRHWATAAARTHSAAPQSQPAFAGASRHTSSGMRTPWKWRAWACR